MRFRQWLLLNERPHASLSDAIKTVDGEAALIDMRSEDWEISGNDPTAQFLKQQLQRIDGYPAFYGRIPEPDGRYLYYDGDNAFLYKVVNYRPTDGINLDSLKLARPWWDYVMGWSSDNSVVKVPAALRPHDLPATEPSYA